MQQFIFRVLFFSLIINSVFFTKKSVAQSQGNVYEQFNNASVNINGKILNMPWCGGLNSFQINHADINNDGKKDLVLYDQNTKLLKTFINVGNSGEIKYNYAPLFEKNFPDSIISFLALRDFNCDGIPDMFFNGPIGIPCYKGYYQNNELKFTFYKNLWARRTLIGDSINVYAQNNDIPSIEDIDGDGDLDITAFDVDGIRAVFHKNMRVEYNLPCDSMKMIFGDLCWGKFFQNTIREVMVNYPCTQVLKQENKQRHTGNCILQMDVNGDGFMDVVGGNTSYSDAQVVYGNGTSTMLIQDTLYNQNGHVLHMPSWPSPFHIDIDNDGDKDLLFTSHNDDISSANFNVIAWYKNIGSATTPNYVYANDSLLTNDMIDVGSNSKPTFFDYDKDGKIDLFIGTEGYLNNDSIKLLCQVAYYKNTSTIGNISFELVTNDFLNLSSKKYKGIFPTFGDVTGDGIDDFIFGSVNGNLSVYKNTSSTNSVAANFIFETDSLSIPTIGKYTMPLVYDFNGDGKNDLMIGNQSGKLTLYEDTSLTVLPKFALKTNSFGNVKAGKASNFYGYSCPFIGKIDNTDSTFLMIGNIDGTIERYDSFINTYATFIKIDSQYSYIKTAARSTPAIADLDGDGKYEMVVGNNMGGLNLYKQQIINGNNQVQFLDNNYVEIYPNPTQSDIHFLINNAMINKKLNLKVIDVMGKVILEKKITTQSTNTISINNISNGMYFLELEIDHQKIIKKIIKN